MNSPDCYSQVTRLDRPIIADIVAASEAAYDQVADETGTAREDVHTIGLCQSVTELMVGILAKRHAVQTIFAGFDSFSHLYLGLQVDGSDELFRADATWQQFIMKDQVTPATPKLLIGTGKEIIQQAGGYGLSRRQLATWEAGTR